MKPDQKSPKIAFLLDFDGPFFNTELVEDEIISYFFITKGEWKRAYKEASIGSTFVNISTVIKLLAQRASESSPKLREDGMWDRLKQVMKEERFCSHENRNALLKLAKMGHIELITQGGEDVQNAKIIASGINEIIEQENKKLPDGAQPHKIQIISEDKANHLKARLKGLVEDRYDVIIQIDDRVEPLEKVQKYARDEFILDKICQYRINTGKYKIVKNPTDFGWRNTTTMMKAVNDISLNILPTLFKEGQMRQTERR